MKIAILGTGNVGKALGIRWAQNGHSVVFGSRDPQSEKVRQLVEVAGANAGATSPVEAIAEAQVVVIATPWGATQATLQALDLAGKILIDATNPLSANFALTIGFDTSAGEQIAGWAPGARVVKAFNTVGAVTMANANYGEQKPAMFICGDDASAKNIVMGLAEELGFAPVDSGGLTVSRYLEPLTMLWIQLAFMQGMGPDIAFALLRRP